MESNIVQECLKNLSTEIKNFDLLSDTSEIWQNISMDLIAPILKYARDMGKCYDWPILRATDYLEFSKNGNRIYFENKYFTRRNMLNTLIIAECVNNKVLGQSGEFIDNIINSLYSIMEETAWWLPAHNSYIRNKKQFPMPDSENPVLDLFACETGSQLALASYLLKDELDNISPFIRKHILSLLKERIIKPYLKEHFWWMGNGDEVLCNWTPWCTMNILLTAALLYQDDKSIDIRKIIEKSAYSLDCFLKDYGDDGCCNEGVQYYRAAGLCLFNAIDILNKITNNAFISLFNNQKIKNIANYVRNMHVDGKYYINFGDCSPVAGRSGVREYLFGKAINDKKLMDFASEEWNESTIAEKLKEADRCSTEGINLYYRYLSIIHSNEVALHEKTANSNEIENIVYYESVGVYIARNEHYTLAVKCGGNGDSHNHNDTGSITLYKDGKPYLIDLGVETYSAKTFSSHRYEIWTMQSSWHNLPEINGFMQKDGTDYHATNIKLWQNEDCCGISFDIAKAYPKEAECKAYKRSVTLTKNGVILEDTYDGEGRIELSLLTEADCEQDRENNIINVKNIGKIKCETKYDVSMLPIYEVSIKDERLKKAWPDKIYKNRFGFMQKIKLIIS